MIRASITLVFIASLLPARALAFSDPDFFARAPGRGGGGGRYFTGSPADGYGCSVCHRGGTTPLITLEGMPESFVAGERYDVTVRWEPPEASHALTLELARPDDTSPGLTLPFPIEETPASMRCEAEAEGAPAVYQVNAGSRVIVGLEDCGARELRFSFVGSEDPELILALAAVRSNGDGLPEGDGVLELRRRIPRAGTRPSSCDVGHADGQGALVVILVLMAALTAARASRAR